MRGRVNANKQSAPGTQWRRNRFAAIVMGAMLTSALMLGGSLSGEVTAWAAEYGTAVVEQGEMTVLRDGRTFLFRASPTSVPVNERDLVRVRNASRIVLKTQDHATMNLGANAVFQCEPWQTPNESGVFRLLFGRLRASVSGLAGGSRFAMKTATATIGVKGTDWFTATTSTGNTSVLGIEHTIVFAGPDHIEQPIGPDQVSVVIAGLPATPSVPATAGVKVEMTKTDAPPPSSPTAANLPAQNALVEQGIVSKDALDKSNKSGEGNLGNQGTQQQNQQQQNQQQQPNLNLDDAQQAAGAIKGKLNLHFEK
jgi:hypothetical protein